MEQALDMKITHGTLLKYALPTILSSIFMNIYSMLDSLFVARFIDTNALSAVNIVGPFLAIALAIGTMIGIGANALVSKQLGEGRNLEAKQNFSFLLWFCVVASAVFCFTGIVFRDPILYWMGADEALFPVCEAYAVPLFLVIPFAMTGILLQMFFVSAGSPGFGFALSLIGGGLNIALDIVFLGVMKMGVEGAAYGTCVGYLIQGAVGLIYFAVKRNSPLCLVKPKWNWKALMQSCYNGMSEMVNMLAVSITMIATNIIMMNIVGSDGVAASSVVMTAQTILTAVYMGYLEGTSPIISYNYGKGDTDKLKLLYKANLRIVGIMSAVTFIAAFLLAKPIALLYAEGVDSVIKMAVEGTFACAPAFLLMGINMFASSMFTAFNNGRISLILAFFRTLVFLIIPLLILPNIFGVWGVWISTPVAEICAVVMSVYYFKKQKSVYHYE